jgi:hypothetical protein
MAVKILTAALIVTAAVIVGAGAVGACFSWQASFTAGPTMKAPGAAGFRISREAFEANPKRYFELLRNAGPAAAARAFAATGKVWSAAVPWGSCVKQVVQLAMMFV